MAEPTVLVSTWRDGLIAIAGMNFEHELKGQLARGLALMKTGSSSSHANSNRHCRNNA